MKLTLPASGRAVDVGKIIGVGRNYAAHADEMESELPSEPLVFLKPPSALIRNGRTIHLPPQSNRVHYEVELVAVIGRRARHVSEEKAAGHVEAYALGLDVTARDLQAEAKEAGRPWSISKGFDTFAPLGPVTSARKVGDPQNLEIRLERNGEIVQEGHTSHMSFPVAELVAYCSRIFTLEPGDLIYTGTPSGVAPIRDGDRLVARGSSLRTLRVSADRKEQSWIA